MKLIKKTTVILLAMVMMMTLFPISVFAEDTELLKEHTYVAYQIFKGEQSSTGDAEVDKRLSNIEWGEDIDSDAFLTKLQEIDAETYGSCEEAKDVAKVVATFTEESDKPKLDAFAALADEFIIGNGTTLGVNNGDLEGKLPSAGYYLIVDVTEFKDGEKDTVRNLSLLQVTKTDDFKIETKTDIPMVEKKVWEDSYKKTEVTESIKYQLEEGYNDVADHDIGDNVPFMLIGSMPSTLSDYSVYKYIFHDTLSKGLTFNNDVKVYINNGDGEILVPAGEYSVTSEVSEEDKTTDLTVEFANIFTISNVNKDSKIIVKYTAELNTDAVIGLEGNPNEVYLEYSNNPNYTPDFDKPEENETGETKVDKVIVFTYALDVTKQDGADETLKLKDAEFVLMNNDGEYYKAVNNGYRWISAEDVLDEGVTVESVSAEELEKLLTDAATKLTSDENGKFTVVGLDDGTYTLKETKAPAGYNLLEETITLVITADTNNGQNWDGVPSNALDPTVKVDQDGNITSSTLYLEVGNTTNYGDANTGIVDLVVENNKGTVLPETGGVGTVVIYSLGAALAIGSVVLLVTKKRMNK